MPDFDKLVGKWVLVTGATSGIGEAFCDELAKQGMNIILVARNREKLDETSMRLTQDYGVETLSIKQDLGVLGAAKNIKKVIDENGIEIECLINNAGYGVLTSFVKADWKVNNHQINSMLTTLSELCHIFSRNMVEKEDGFIINVASLAAFAPNIPGFMYNAIKSYVVNLSITLDMELKPSGVKCLALCPGLTSTNFPAAMGAEEMFAKAPSWRWMSSEQTVSEAFDALDKGKSVYIPGKVNKFLAAMYDFMPNQLKYEMGKRGIIL